ncbi:MAG: multifunctional tRNA N6-adenosine(37)-N6- threonylcarbamoyltransferase complex dimerization subunit type 1 TsaB/ribosomal protein alanine acetyltransferase/tRNA (adenosine(37)-N6)-threonylcarbamoyltransferase complex transferase subunit TsaD, partial [Eggerthellaceae bacterium]|nr:multifunctional tRNA N6-adenosine(37)-N6- threonylcarbamoyltransferase complex dimerization subunit type 1 TsaB/ribosomal protein alanine acetyltransferase/tRNA (adenosine(37)-N6)-threonylcarbamoyltransferase complex transferase subunit TsaD [Eggerthellaceae bacterium]
IHKQQQAGNDIFIPDVAASFQQAVIDVQVAKASRALADTGAHVFCLGGGVAANRALRAAYEAMGKKLNVRIVLPPASVCGDNAAMIAAVALDKYKRGQFASFSVDVAANAPLDEVR